MEDDVLLLAVFGVRVIEAPRLSKPVLFIEEEGIALIDSTLSRECRKAVLDNLVTLVASLAEPA